MRRAKRGTQRQKRFGRPEQSESRPAIGAERAGLQAGRPDAELDGKRPRDAADLRLVTRSWYMCGPPYGFE